jgi:hypothetical protein
MSIDTLKTLDANSSILKVTGPDNYVRISGTSVS